MKYKDIEMAVTLSTANGLPFTSHMGIFRTPAFITGLRLQDQVHQGVSIPLHALLHALYPEKIYMIFAPKESMIRILENKLPTAFIGNNRERNSYPSCVREKDGDIVIFDQSPQKIGRLSRKEEKETWFSNVCAPHIAIDLHQLASA